MLKYQPTCYVKLESFKCSCMDIMCVCVCVPFCKRESKLGREEERERERGFMKGGMTGLIVVKG